MSIESNCPGCGAKVRVPESLLGKRVKCPKCEMIFTAEESAGEYESVPDEGERSAGREDDYGMPPPSSRPRARSGRSNAVAIKSIGVLSVGMTLGCIYALLGIILGGLFTVLSLIGAGVAGRNGGAEALLTGGCSIVLFPIIYGAIGFIGGIIMAAFYNLVSGFIGGVQLELSQRLD